MIKTVVIIILLFWASILDLKTRFVPNTMCIAVALAGFIGFDSSNLLGVAMAIPFFIAAVLTGEEYMGGGDIKMIAAMGFALGYNTVLKCIFASFALLVLFLIILRLNRGNRHAAVPLIPFFAAGYIITVIMEVLQK